MHTAASRTDIAKARIESVGIPAPSASRHTQVGRLLHREAFRSLSHEQRKARILPIALVHACFAQGQGVALAGEASTTA